MKKLVALVMALAMMLGLFGIASAETAGGELIYGSSTELSGTGRTAPSGPTTQRTTWSVP